jgi:catechol 2,3-dioxygenase-like lactoylglutathione lyase family enzyme
MSTVPARLSVVTLGTRDQSAMRAFYRSLGWVEVPASNDEFAAFLLSGVLLALFPLTDLAAEAAPGAAAPSGWPGVTLACNVESRQRVDDVFAGFVAAGATVVAEPVDRSWGGRSGYVADPEGNRWEIACVPNAVFDDRGAVAAFG